MIIPMKYTHFGWRFGDKVGGGRLHSGVDLNYGAPYQDKGMEVKATASGQIVYSKNAGKGWGNLVVIYHPEHRVWSRYAHLEKRYYDEGIQVKEGDVIGTVGSTGGDWAPHCHFDIIVKKLPSWTSYTKYFSQTKLREYYVDPIPFIEGVNNAMETDWKVETRKWAETILDDVDGFVENMDAWKVLELVRKATKK
jgi:murein DD-endopeptidase MepM/ murein hydrolase activator NlpD